MSTVDVTVPTVGESITEVVVSNWLVSEGGAVKQDEPVATLETDKVTIDLPAPESGALTEIVVAEGETAEIGAILARITVGAEGMATATTETQAAPKPTTPAAPQAAEQPADAPPASDSRVMPAAARLLAEHGLAASDVKATGPGGRLLKEDVQRHVVGAETTKPDKLSPGTAGSPMPKSPPAVPLQLSNQALDMRHEEVVPMTPLRKRVAERLVESQHNAALLTTFNEIDMSEVIRLRKQHQELFQKTYGIKLGFLSFFVKATIEALKTTPELNAEIREQSIVYRNYYDIGIAVGGGRGLVVPVIRNAERLSFAQIETTIADFGDRAMKNRIELAELQGGTFTISNGGVYGALLSTPIINPPQSGVLGLQTIQDRPVVRDGEIVVRPMMYIALTYDHRIVDGREAVTFLKRVKTGIEEPARILLEV
ncbi:MAG: 2-oxoglutarate dehydrogenase complex dihydrolipoyllysine-residue succinyltransferase [Actinobacteria bacterium]|nr:2-oxoglutarate dehydrogenase complex dihydrolipoyllysine-residue succinyltransferase [Actinomycetota bacterium]